MPPVDAPPQHHAIEAVDLTRRFGASWVLRGVSLRVAPGEIVGLLGANGSGKSTLLRILATLLRPNGGAARVGGVDLAADPDGVRRQVGFLAHSAGLYDDLSARENLTFASTMLGRPAGDLDELLARVGLTAVADRRVRGFSAGMQRRLALARLLLGAPRVLLLDEPYSNLDADGIALMNGMLRDAIAQGAAALVVLHETAPAAGLLDRSVTIVDGRIAGPGGPARRGTTHVRLPAEVP
jgi:heme exporter protein A